jgi:hypothetical protein
LDQSLDRVVLPTNGASFGRSTSVIVGQFV